MRERDRERKKEISAERALRDDEKGLEKSSVGGSAVSATTP